MTQDDVLRVGQRAAARSNRSEGAIARGDVTLAIANAELLAHEAYTLLREATPIQLARAAASKASWDGVPVDDRSAILIAAAQVKVRNQTRRLAARLAKGALGTAR
jgi:hypothetical protein